MDWMKNGGLLVDSGSNIGQILLYVAPLSGCRVMAFDPFPPAREWLKECLSYHRGWEVEVFDFGLGRESAKCPMQCDGARSTTNLEWYTA